MIVAGIVLATFASFVASAVFYALPPVSKLIVRESNPNQGYLYRRRLARSCCAASLRRRWSQG